MKKKLIISPHYDDAVGSCAGMIIEDKNEVQYTIMTIFSQILYNKCSDFAKYLHEDVWRIKDKNVRKKENDEACLIIGAHHIEAPFFDAIYRKKDDIWLYPCNGDIFKGINKKDDIDIIKNYIQTYIGMYDEIYFPSGVGEHVDHMILASIGKDFLKKHNNIYFYLDFSYEEKERCISDELKMKKYYISDYAQSIKEQAITKYQSQINMIFQSIKQIHNFYAKYYNDDLGYYEIIYG